MIRNSSAELWDWDDARVGDGSFDPIASEGGAMVATPDAEGIIAPYLGVDPNTLGDPMQPQISTAHWLDSILPGGTDLKSMLNYLLIGGVIIGGGIILLTTFGIVKSVGSLIPSMPKNLLGGSSGPSYDELTASEGRVAAERRAEAAADKRTRAAEQDAADKRQDAADRRARVEAKIAADTLRASQLAAKAAASKTKLSTS